MRLSVPSVLVWILVVGLSGAFKEDSATKAPSSYKWKAGKWGSCHSQMKCGEGQQQRSVWCAHLDDRTSLKVLCDPNSMPAEVRPCFQVCDEHRGKLSWRVGDWGPCLPIGQETHKVSGVVQVTFHSTSRYLKGSMLRDVVCVYRRSNHSQARLVSDEACKHFETKPNNSLPCTVPRSQDCIVTEFGEWLECKGCGTSNRTRLRKVLVANRHGGRPCPRLSETEPCNEAVACLQSPNRIREYRLRIGAWSECFSLEHNHEDIQFGFWASVGYQTREVTCKDENGIPNDLSHCLGEDDPHVPARVQACVVPSDCLVSSWSEWSVLKEGCLTQSGEVYPELRKRTRQVLRVPLGSGEPCPHLEEVHEMADKGKLQPCTKYKWEPTEWSNCILTDQMKITKVVCGGGIRRRNLTCLRAEDLVPVSPSFCMEPPPPVVHRCSIQCRQDCVVSSWSMWGPCQPIDCKDTFGGSNFGYQERSRTILVEPEAEGVDDCPPLRQVDSCEHPSCFQWRTTEFSQCDVLNKELRCGQGKQSRTTYCVDLEGLKVNEALCAINIPMPEITVPCYIPCPSDCVLSTWSEWSSCSRICSDKREFGRRSRNRTILASSGHGGTPCPLPNELTETEVCNQHSCFGFGWKTFPWQTCQVFDSKEPCGLGKQIRDVACMKEDERRVLDKKCMPLPRPPISRNCTVPCPKDCSLSKFSDWSECKDVCFPDDKNVAIPATQERVRHVLRWPESGRHPCPTTLKEVRACPARCSGGENCLFPCHTYSWAVQDWGSCVLPDNTDCGAGFRTRGVTCMRNNQEEVEMSFCLQLNQTIPTASQPCQVECDHPCVFSEWSDWSSCPLMCGGIQIRSRTLLSDSQQIKECKDEYHYPLNETKGCPCNVHSALAEGDWSDCILYDLDESTPINGVEVKGRCGVGRRLRRVACYDKNNKLADPYHCTPTGYEEDACMLSCPVDCVMSSWSDWSACSAVCGPGMQYRTRKINRPAYEGGRPCPPTDAANVNRELRLCSAPCHQYQWKAHNWSPCEIASGAGCGTGRRTRAIRCHKIGPGNKEDMVREEYCDPVLRPADIDYCPVPCPMDCILSEWGEWTECSKPCNSSQLRKRTRIIERKSLESTRACPLLEEQAFCTLNENCFRYAWNLTEWTSCIIPDGATCGEGIKQRGVICQRSDLRSVDEKFCSEADTIRPNAEEVACRVDCPIDCEVSQWSDWNSVDCKPCGSSGVVVRRRQVTVNPSSTGRPCPTQMMQRKPCPAQPCYYWYTSPWSECELEGGQCGHGRRRREVLCQRKDGAIVERRYCMEVNTSQLSYASTNTKWLDKLLNIQEEEPCFTPCPGDCHVSEWSEWSPCHRDCINGEQVGMQTRSRAIEIQPSPYGESCPRQLWETKPCFGGPCLSFSWQVRHNSVHCVRSDGLVVIGGCHGKPRPCVPHCRVPHSECGHSGECMCESGYRSLYREGLVLDEPRELIGCELINLTNSSHHTGPMAGESEVRVVYFPNDNEVSFWMYAMIAVGSAFIIFVAVTIYLMCHSTVRRAGSPLRRHSLTIRRNTSKDPVSGIKP